MRNWVRSVSSAAIESARSSGTPALSSVESSCVKNRTSLRLPALNDGQFEFEPGALFFQTDVNRNQSLTPQFRRDGLIGIGSDRAGAKLPVGGYSAKVISVAIYLMRVHSCAFVAIKIPESRE